MVILPTSDWNTFNNKQNALSIGNLNGTTNQVSVSGGTGAIIGAGVTLSLPQNITIPGSIATQNSVLDNGSGNMTLGGYLGLLGSRQLLKGILVQL